MKQQTFSDIEYSNRKRKTKREKFLETMETLIPLDEWVALIQPLYYKGKRGRPPCGTETMLRIYLLQAWFNLSDEGVEDVIYDSNALRKFVGIDFLREQVTFTSTSCLLNNITSIFRKHSGMIYGKMVQGKSLK